MNDTSQDDLEVVLGDLASIELKKQRALSQLLGELHDQANHHLACHVYMGEVSSYLMSVPLRWIADKVGFAADLPIFSKSANANESKRVQIDEETVESIQQRQPDWGRQLQMATYLATRKHHKFPPLLLVGYQGWVYEERHEKWGTDARAMDDSLTLRQLEPTSTYWNLDDSETTFYALDGQHRLMAIIGLRDLIQNGVLHALDKERKVKRGKGLSRDEIIAHIQSGGTSESNDEIHERLQRLMNERIGVEIVPAVRKNETYGEALRRLRQMFVDVNENAKALSKSELVQLDETNGFRVVARRLLAEHELLRSSTTSDGSDRFKVDTSSTNLSDRSEYYTTLNTLAETVRRYLKHNKKLSESINYASWDKLIAKDIFVRPNDSFLEQGTQDMIEYFDQLAKLPSHVAFIQGKPASELRRSEDGEDNILFRPVVQTALAEALGRLVTEKNIKLKDAVEAIGKQEEEGQLKLTPHESPWFGVLSDPVSKKMRRHKSHEELCCRMFQYLLGGGIKDDVDRAKLKEDFAVARYIDPDEKTAINLEGKTVKASEVNLPNPWR